MRTNFTVTFTVHIYRSQKRVISIVETDKGFIPLIGSLKANMDTLKAELERTITYTWSYLPDCAASRLVAYPSIQGCLDHADRVIAKYTKLPKQHWCSEDKTQEVSVMCRVFPRGIKVQEEERNVK